MEYDNEYYDWYIRTNQERFEEWVNQMEQYYLDIQESGVPINCIC